MSKNAGLSRRTRDVILSCMKYVASYKMSIYTGSTLKFRFVRRGEPGIFSGAKCRGSGNS
ncbi:MAG: hypothetical protein Q4C96_02015 [Planctomycetia bacterium]|nr:hypothetical protein [Planctomycetia bacterium]